MFFCWLGETLISVLKDKAMHQYTITHRAQLIDDTSQLHSLTSNEASKTAYSLCEKLVDRVTLKG